MFCKSYTVVDDFQKRFWFSVDTLFCHFFSSVERPSDVHRTREKWQKTVSTGTQKRFWKSANPAYVLQNTNDDNNVKRFSKKFDSFHIFNKMCFAPDVWRKSGGRPADVQRIFFWSQKKSETFWCGSQKNSLSRWFLTRRSS